MVFVKFLLPVRKLTITMSTLPNQPGSSPPPPRPPQTQPSQLADLIPTEEEVGQVGSEVHANKVANPATIQKILQAVKAAHNNANATDLFSLAWACYHNGASRYTTLSGESHNRIALAELKDHVENHCTLRQFCMFYAKICYNKGKEERTPPANWANKGFKEDTKYAAFDFFNGVSNDAVPKPKGGLRHQPTADEKAAHALNATMAIIESRGQDNQFSNRGNMLAMQQVRTGPAPPLITFN